jgi:DMSO reductase anchor subunit
MNTTLNNDFIFGAAGNTSVEQLLNLRNIQNFYVTYLMPWIGSITFITNMVVAVLCAIIYSKTKKKNHKPAFVFIGVLSFFDMLVGRFVFFTLF